MGDTGKEQSIELQNDEKINHNIHDYFIKRNPNAWPKKTQTGWVVSSFLLCCSSKSNERSRQSCYCEYGSEYEEWVACLSEFSTRRPDLPVVRVRIGQYYRILTVACVASTKENRRSFVPLHHRNSCWVLRSVISMCAA